MPGSHAPVLFTDRLEALDLKFLPLPLRFFLPLLCVLLLAAYITVPIVDQLTLRWFVKDLDTRASLITTTFSESMGDTSVPERPAHAQTLLDRIVSDERVLGAGICTAQGAWSVRSLGFPAAGFDCATLAQLAQKQPPLAHLPYGLAHVAVLPLAVDQSGEQLVLLHDMSFVERRSQITRQYLIVLFVVLGSVIALITLVIAQLTWRGWLAGVQALLRGEGLVRPFGGMGNRELMPVVEELRGMLRELEDQRRVLHRASNIWTPERLRSLLKSDLRGDEIIVVSNREPYIHEHKPEGGIKINRPASGLVTAVEPVMRACSGIWIAHGSGSADRDTVDKLDQVAVPPEDPSYQLKRVWLTEAEEAGYYFGFANEGLWPLCHIAHVRPVFRASDWEHYRAVNQRFANAVVSAARTEDPVVLVQDYHFALVPRMVREKLPRATIITFWHIPWPNSESFSICPWRSEIVDGLLGSTILGFHTPYHCKHFTETVDHLLEANIEQEHSTITYGGHQTLVKNYPISIAWPEGSMPPVEACRQELRERIGADANHLIAIGVDRFDYTKGLIERVSAVAAMLEQHPELVGRFSLVQIAAPTRSSLDEYRTFQERLDKRVHEVNARFGQPGYQPVHLFASHHDAITLQRYYRAADACMVTSLHDGMNLVCKEFIAARDDERGVLLLSRFAGAADELPDALIINPYHIEDTASALHDALTMSDAEQRDRMRSLRSTVQHNNVYLWAADMLADAARTRLRERIEARISANRKES
ncbi:trehalose-6-phosphate synthase [Silvimonas sp. JCM 19000]